jgi:hypothetical protein
MEAQMDTDVAHPIVIAGSLILVLTVATLLYFRNEKRWTEAAASGDFRRAEYHLLRAFFFSHLARYEGD